MKARLMLSLLALCMLSAAPMNAGQYSTVQTIDVHTYTSNRGLSGTSHMIGPYTYHQFKNGSSVVTQTIGENTYYQFKRRASDKNQSIGWYRFSGPRKGLSGTNQRLGLDLYRSSNDAPCTSQTIGQYAYYECK